MKIKKVIVRTLILFTLLLGIGLFYLLFINKEPFGLAPFNNYCMGLRIDRKMVYRFLPNKTFRFSNFYYDVNEERDKKIVEKTMEDFKSDIENGTFPNSEDYWADPYCLGKEYWLE